MSYFLDYLTGGLSSGRTRRRESADVDGQGDGTAAMTPQAAAQPTGTAASRLPVYEQLRRPPARATPRVDSRPQASAEPESTLPPVAPQPAPDSIPLPEVPTPPLPAAESSTSASTAPADIRTTAGPTAAGPTSGLAGAPPSTASGALDAPAAHSEPRLSLKDCRSRACAGVVDTFKRALRQPAGAQPTTPNTTEPTPDGQAEEASGADSGVSSSNAGASRDEGNGRSGETAGKSECPPDTWELGRATWTFLHSVAAHYPDHPTPRQQELMRGMMDGLAEFYPCEVCAEHLREQVKDKPPQVATAKDLNLWLCGIHNEVNEMLGKPLFDCSRVLERWRDGPEDGSCD